MKKPIKIGVDGRLLQGNLTGVGKYVLNLINYMTNHDERFAIIVVTNRALSEQVNNRKIKIVTAQKKYAKVKPMIWSRFFSSKLLNKQNVDIFLSGDSFLPYFLKTKNIISVVHDINQILVPETMSMLRLLTTKLFFKKDLAKARLIVSNSFGTAAKLERYYNRKTDVVIYPITDKWYKKLGEEEVVDKLSAININFPYILTVATEEPRKNLLKTLNAFIALKKENKIPLHNLLLVGSKGWKSKSLEQLIAGRSDVIRMGYIGDAVMPYLYNGADIFVFPSKYEGFGIPPREALLCGTKVIVSDIPELREATYNEGTYINADDEEEFKNAILHNLNEKHKKVDPANFFTSDQLENFLPCLKDRFASLVLAN